MHLCIGILLCLECPLYRGRSYYSARETSLLRTPPDHYFSPYYLEVIQYSTVLCTYIGTQNGVLITEVSTFQRFVMERSHCIHNVL